MCLKYISLSLVCVGFTQLLVLKIVILAKFGELLAIILVPFQPCPLSSLLLGLNNMSVRSAVAVSQAPEALFSSPDPYSSFLSVIPILYYS